LKVNTILVPKLKKGMRSVRSLSKLKDKKVTMTVNKETNIETERTKSQNK